MHVFKHPKFYEEYRKRAKEAQREAKQQATSVKQQASSNKLRQIVARQIDSKKF